MAENRRAQPTEYSDGYTHREPHLESEKKLRLKRVSFYLYVMRYYLKEFGLINGNVTDRLGELIITLMMMMIIIIIISDTVLPFLKLENVNPFRNAMTQEKFSLLFIPSRKLLKIFLNSAKIAPSIYFQS